MPKDAQHVSASAPTQKQSGSAEPELREADKPEKHQDEIQFFDTTVVKLVERKNEDTGETETFEVMSDNLYPGEKLKRADDEEKAAKKAEQARKAAHRASSDRKATEARIDERELDENRK